MFAPVTVWIRKIENGIERLARAAAPRRRTPTSRTADAAKTPIVVAEVQPQPFALRDREHEQRRAREVTSTAPSTSKLWPCASRLSASRNGASDERRHADRDVDEEDPLPAEQRR